jgi:hypothetical protein
MKKSNRELNEAHDQRQADKIRPKQREWNFEPLEAVIRQWKARAHEQT